MAIAFHSSGVWSSTTSPDTPSLTISVGDFVLGGTALNPTTLSISGVTDSGPGGNSYSSLGAAASQGSVRGEMWGTGVSAAHAGTGTSVAITGTITDSDAAFASYSGVLATAQYTTFTGNSANPSVSITTQDNNNYVVVFFLWADANGTTAGTGTLRNSDSNVSASCAIVDNTSASPGSVTCSCTHSAGNWVALALELRSVSGAAAQVPHDLAHSMLHQAMVAQ